MFPQRQENYSAHPRSRGEHMRWPATSSRAPGSSPLARGTLRGLGLLRRGARLIPARAGNTEYLPLSVGSSPAHPRSRGEHHCPESEWKTRCGSSPLARGTPVAFAVFLCARRLIPARAGNTAPRHSPWVSCAAHPRSRGEHDCTAYRVGFVTGSSPLARGTQLRARNLHRLVRLIPARAGNTGP